MVGYKRKQFLADRLAGLYDEPRPSAQSEIGNVQIAAMNRQTLNTKPQNGTHWTCLTITDQTELSKSNVKRGWKVFAMQPHRQKHFKMTTDRYFVGKVHDIVGLYLSPPYNTMVLYVDEKRLIHAYKSNKPMLPLGLGYVEDVAHDYVRHGTTTLYAALEIATSQVPNRCALNQAYQSTQATSFSWTVTADSILQ